MSRILLNILVLRSYTIVSLVRTHTYSYTYPTHTPTHIPPSGLKSPGIFRVQLWRVQQLLCSRRSQTSLSHFLLMYLITSWSIHFLRLWWSWVHFPSPSEITWTYLKYEAVFGGCCLALLCVLRMIIPHFWAEEEEERKESPLGPPCKTTDLMEVQLGISTL